MYGILAFTFWAIVSQRPDIVLQFHEDSQTMIRVATIGRNFQMRYATRTARLPIAWMHERFNQGYICSKYELSARMAADVDTEGFTDAENCCRHVGSLMSLIPLLRLLPNRVPRAQ